MGIPDKIVFTKGEKIAEIICAVTFAAMIVTYIVLMAVGYLSGESILMMVSSGILYSICTVCSVWPQGTNLVSRPEYYSDKGFHRLRKGCIAAAFIFLIVVFAITVIGKV
ncbi:MAG: hypothetical protein J6A16_05680 [Oscillospiraceae bacterium]|nr:hypothetical protein [Oscillospiraceae bacterium]